MCHPVQRLPGHIVQDLPWKLRQATMKQSVQRQARVLSAGRGYIQFCPCGEGIASCPGEGPPRPSTLLARPSLWKQLETQTQRPPQDSLSPKQVYRGFFGCLDGGTPGGRKSGAHRPAVGATPRCRDPPHPQGEAQGI